MVLLSSIYQDWAWKLGSRLGATTLRFSPSDCFETFPFPPKERITDIKLGDSYIDLRNTLMHEIPVSLTDIFNMLHNSQVTSNKIEILRQLQKQIDEAVRDAYGWNDIDLEHGFHAVSYLPDNDNIRYTISEPARIEILRRLAQLNRQRWQEEQNKQ